MEGQNPRYTIRLSLNQRAPKLSATGLNREDVFQSKETLSDRFNELFKLNVFSDYELRKLVPKNVVEKLNKDIKEGKEVDDYTADVVAQAMKEWALSRGCTHYSHWFHPLRGTTAEKHDSFINFFGPAHDLRYEFSGSCLMRGEPDASSFPGGGLRSTFEARGYTAWDPSSPPFVLEGPSGNTLLIPSMYVSWSGEALDHKTPLLRSTTALSNVATRMLHLLGDTDVSQVSTTLGPEQEFFVIDRAYYNARPDLYTCGRTLLGAKPAKGQQKSDHYFGPIPLRVLAFIQDVEEELWKLGIPTKTRHNEVAPSQHEMAPIFEDSNVASDHNLLCMQLLEQVAARHDLVCLLHEKPFAGINGSGKHNNWSMCTDTGINLLDPTNKPLLNKRFLTFLAATIKAVDMHADILRASIATAGNDFRLGANEAPPAIMSVYLGDELNKIVESLIEDAARRAAKPDDPSPKKKPIELAPSTLDMGLGMRPLRRDRTDRNRTSPFAFTGNKFEFRAPGSSSQTAHTVMILNLIVADAIAVMTEEILALSEEKRQKNPALSERESIDVAVKEVIGSTLVKHCRIIFNGDGYSQQWLREAEARGLSNHRDAVDGLQAFTSDECIDLFVRHRLLTKAEVVSRSKIAHEEWIKTKVIELNCLSELAATHVLPAAMKQQTLAATSLTSLKAVLPDGDYASQERNLAQISVLINTLLSKNTELKELIAKAKPSAYSSLRDCAVFIRDSALPVRDLLREACDSLEKLVDDTVWVLPKYQEILTLK